MAVHFNTLQPVLDEDVKTTIDKQPEAMIAVCAVVDQLVVTALGGRQLFLVPQDRWEEWLRETAPGLANETLITLCAFGPEVA